MKSLLGLWLNDPVGSLWLSVGTEENASLRSPVKTKRSWRRVCPRARSSVRHRVNDHIHSEPISRQPESQWVTRLVNPFPRVAVVAVAGDEDHHASGVIRDPFVMRNVPAFFARDAGINVIYIRDLNDFVNIKIAMEDRVIKRQFSDRVY